MKTTTVPAGAAQQGWPAWGLVGLVIVAAVYSFALRPPPPFPPTQVHSDKLLVNGLAESGGRIVAAGELGHILIADAPEGPWRAARIEPPRSSMFTRARFIDDRTAIAAGHDGWIVRSEDRGESWKEVAYDASRPDPVLGLAGPFDGKLFAVGAFGLVLVSLDGGQTWQPEPLALDGEKKAAAPAVDPNEDPFASFSAADSGADRHLNAMARLGDGSLLLVGERGLVARSTDLGASWKKLETGYPGSFFGVLALPENGALAFGMRGNAYLSTDLGATWQKAQTPVEVSLFGGTVLENGDVILVGDNNTILRSTDRGATFTVASQAKIRGLAAGLAEVVELPGGRLLLAGDIGVRLHDLAGAQP
jgi:photosystem II stability/assembly factor-like uncharacterized protein